MLELNVGGECGGSDRGCMACADTDPTCAEMRAPQQTLTGSITVASGGTTVLAIHDMSVAADATGVTLDGDFTLNGTSASATALHWAPGDCLPTSGTVVLGDPAMTLTFLATTPADGIVQVQVGPFPATMAALFDPCP